MSIEHKNDEHLLLVGKEVFSMSNWTLFFTFTGVAVVTAQLFRFVDFIEHSSKEHIVFQEKTSLLNELKEKLWILWRN